MKYLVTQLKDAYVEYWAEVEATGPEDAVSIAKLGSKWERGQVREFDHAIYPIDEVTPVEK
jgi:hypothetical protein